MFYLQVMNLFSFCCDRSLKRFGKTQAKLAVFTVCCDVNVHAKSLIVQNFRSSYFCVQNAHTKYTLHTKLHTTV